MVSPAVYLGLALGGVLALVGAYLVRLDARTRALERRASRARDPDDEDAEP